MAPRGDAEASSNSHASIRHAFLGCSTKTKRNLGNWRWTGCGALHRFAPQACRDVDGLSRENFGSPDISAYSFRPDQSRPSYAEKYVCTDAYLPALSAVPHYNTMGLLAAEPACAIWRPTRPMGIVPTASRRSIKTLASSGIKDFSLFRFVKPLPLRRNITIEDVGNAALFRPGIRHYRRSRTLTAGSPAVPIVLAPGGGRHRTSETGPVVAGPVPWRIFVLMAANNALLKSYQPADQRRPVLAPNQSRSVCAYCRTNGAMAMSARHGLSPNR